MLRCKILTSLIKLHKRSLTSLKLKENEDSNKYPLEKIRNIGILAHIDAGKTTTTERMLYYSGEIDHMGEVHHGNTVTDYMEQERKRGITITSAAVTFYWKNYKFNLIDTPGHIDFTMGVEQTLCVLDGAVVVLDGSAGVEPQTMTVWRQANKYNIPRIIYVNKMDRPDANFNMSVQSVKTKLDTDILPVHFPIRNENELTGLVDIVTLEKWIFSKKDKGKVFQKVQLDEKTDSELLVTAKERRQILTDKLSSMDDKLANIVIEQNSLDNVSAQILIDSLRRVTFERKAVPILLGSSYKNIGVQPLMDAVVLYLPHPGQSILNNKYACFGDNLAGKVFKIVHDKQRGPLAFTRIYNGNLTKNQKLYNVTRNENEQCTRLYVVNADEYQEISNINKGNIVALSGLKKTVTGDLIVPSASVAKNAKKVMLKASNVSAEEVETFFMAGANIPDPVFFCSIEPPSLSYQTALDNALMELEKEDPSLRVKQDNDTGQTVLAGMGELHIEIIKERIRSEYKIDVDLGELQIAYKETINKSLKEEHNKNIRIGENVHTVRVIMSLIPDYEGSSSENPVLLLDNSQEYETNLRAIHPKVMKAIKSGLVSAFANGPKLGCPVINVAVKLHWLELGRKTSTTVVSSSVSECIRKMLKECDPIILEPVMDVEVVASKSHSNSVVADLERRRAEIHDIYIRGQNKIVNAIVPLSDLLGYATSLRISTSGNATFTMEFSHYRAMDPYNERLAIKRVTGF